MIRVPFYKIIRWSIVLIMVFQVNLVSGQIPVIPVPQHVEMNRYDNLYQNPHSNILNIISSSHSTFIQKQKESIIREVEENERKRVAINKQYILREYLKSNSIPLPNFSETPGTEYFHSARKEILEMLEGKKAMSLKRAVFITENAFFQNQMKYEEFDTAIQNLKHICLLKMQEEKLDMNDDFRR